MAQNYRQSLAAPADDEPTAQTPDQQQASTSTPQRSEPASAASAPDGPPRQPDPGDGDPTKLGDPGKRALDRQKEIARVWKERYEEQAAKVREYEDANLTDQQRRDREFQELQHRAERAERDVLVRDIASEYGLTARQARWLHGNTREEIEQSYEEMLADGLVGAAKPDPGPTPDEPQQPLNGQQQRDQHHPDSSAPTAPPPGRPTPKPRGGGNPEEPPDEMDPYKLAAGIARHH